MQSYVLHRTLGPSLQDECFRRCRYSDKHPRQAPDIEDLGCEYYEKFSRNQRRPSIAPGVYFLFCFVWNRYNLSDFQQRKDTCPYFFARSCLDDADVIVFNYQVWCLDALQSSMCSIHRLVPWFFLTSTTKTTFCSLMKATTSTMFFAKTILSQSRLRISKNPTPFSPSRSLRWLSYRLSKEFQKRESAVNAVSVVKTEYGGKQIIQMPRAEPSSMVSILALP